MVKVVVVVDLGPRPLRIDEDLRIDWMSMDVNNGILMSTPDFFGTLPFEA